MTSLGPFPIWAVVLVAALIPAWLAARLSARGRPDVQPRVVSGTLFDALLLGLLAARAGYVLRWWSEYAEAPMAILAIGDRGFAMWSGLPVALGWMLWKTRLRPAARRPVLLGAGVGLLAWGAMTGALALIQPGATPMPTIPVVTLDGKATRLDTERSGPTVLNLWATWCPPCIREMPALADAQARYPEVTFLFVNQGEDAGSIRRFLDRRDLALDHVLLDPGSGAMRALGARALPTTFFIDADGQLVDQHMGELTRARLADILHRRLDARPRPSS